MDKEKLKELLKEIQKAKTFEKIKKTNDYGLLVDILQGIIGKIQLAKGEQGIRGEKGERGFQGETGKNGRDGKDGRNGIDGKNANETIIIREVLKEIPIPKDGINGADGSPDRPEDIRNKLESLDDEDRLDVKAIKGIEELVKKLEKKIDSKTVYVGSSSGGLGGHVQYYDLSSQLDGGVTRTFSMPAFARILSVQLSSFPNILRPLIDWTSDASLSTLTITSAIPDASLSADQTFIVLYANL